MFSKFTRLAVMVTALMAVVGVAQAAASTWTVSGSTTFTASGTPGSLSTSSGTLSCTGGTATGAFSSSTHTGTTWAGIATGSVTFAGCRVGGTTYAVSGTYTLNATSWASGVTSGNLNPLAVSVTLAGRQLCSISTAATPPTGTYTNSTGVLGVPATSGLTVANGSGGTCPFGTGTGRLTAISFTVTSSPVPVITYS